LFVDVYGNNIGSERFSQGVNWDNIFSPSVYDNDFHTILVNGKETEVEFRKIATLNIRGNTFNNGQGNSIAQVIHLMGFYVILTT
jgi:hypothetical protein